MRLLGLVRVLLVALSWALFAADARAEPGGYELALAGDETVAPGEPLRLAATVYEASGLATLRPAARARLLAVLYRYEPNASRVEVTRTSVSSDGAGHATFELDVPAIALGSRVELAVQVLGPRESVARTFEIPLDVVPAVRLDVLTDRVRYEPGESVRIVALLRSARAHAPLGDARVRLLVTDARGTALLDRVVATRASGVVAADVELPSGAPTGAYLVVASFEGRGSVASATRRVEVGERTVERMLVRTTLARAVVAPGQPVQGEAVVTAGSGAPIEGASVRVRLAGATEDLVTDADGKVRFRLLAPAYVEGDAAQAMVEVRAEHPAYGVRADLEPVVVARHPYRVEVVAAGGALVQEVRARAFLHVLDPLSNPAPVGLPVEVRGVAVPGGLVRTVVGAEGFVEVPLQVRVGTATRRDGGACAGAFAVDLDVAIGREGLMSTTACVPVHERAELSVVAEPAVVAPGGRLTVQLARRPSAASAEVLVELMVDGEVVGSAFAPARVDRVSVEVPRGVTGALFVRARPLGRVDVTPALDREGAVAFREGGLDAVLVRPADAFALTLDAGQETLPVGGRARVALRPSVRPEAAFFSLVARDLTMHGGEADYVLPWLERFARATGLGPAAEDRSLLVRATLAAAVLSDSDARGFGPLVRLPWDTTPYGGAFPVRNRGELRDPLRLRDHLLRQRAGAVMTAIESAAAEELFGEPGEPRRYVTARGLRPDVVARMVEDGRLSPEDAETLGGAVMTLAQLESVDPSFRFANLAARLCRTRLAQLMIHLLAFTDPENPAAARAIEGVPPSRWLERLVELGVVGPDQLVDPWGHRFVFQPARGGAPLYVLSERAPTFELVSPGADGRPGTADDVRDPFARVLPPGSIYAVHAGEDELMKQIAAIAPGTEALRTMLEAYDAESLAALDERREGVVRAQASEAELDDGVVYEGYGEGAGMGAVGYGRGGGGSGAMLSGRAMVSPSAAPMMAGEYDDEPGHGRPESPRGPGAPPPPPVAPLGSTLARVGEQVRSRFPATLHLVAEAALQEGTVVEIPLADALTTYRVEAIAWTASGYLTTARTEFRVDQRATIDAAIPGHATVGDAIRVPVRIENRGATPLTVRYGFAAEGLTLAGLVVHEAEVPARGVVERIETVTVSAEGRGELVVRLVDASDAPLDAVRRPLVVYPDARLVRETSRHFVVGADTVVLETPADASERGPATVRIAHGLEFFGPLPSATEAERLERAYVLRFAGLPVAEEDRATAARALVEALEHQLLPFVRDGAPPSIHDPSRLGRLLSVGFGHAALAPEHTIKVLEALAFGFPEGDDRGNNPWASRIDAQLLLALAPLAGAPGLPEPATATLTRLRRLVSNAAARSADDVGLTVLQAAALAASAPDGRDARAEELVRRTARETIRGSQGTFLEGSDVGAPHARDVPTALLALTHVCLGQRALAFEAFRGLVNRPERALGAEATRFAGLVAARLFGGAASNVRLELDGRPVELRDEAGVRVASLEGLGRPGRHTLRVVQTEQAAALVSIDLRYGRPWTAPEARRLPVSVEVVGEVGARDTRSGLALEVRNDGARLLRRPVVEVDLPAGTELDQPTREALAALTREAPVVEARTLRLALRPLAPGASVRLPLRVRFTVAGALRGLGVTVFDDTPMLGHVARAVLPSRALALEDHGEEPTSATPGSTEPPAPPPPPPPPPVLPVLRVLTTDAEVIR